MKLKDTIGLAYTTVSSNKLRSGITISIIALGIAALVGINTAISAMNSGLRDSFSTMGATGFSIAYKERFKFGGNGGRDTKKVNKNGKRQKKSNLDKPITIDEAEAFKNTYIFPAKVALQLYGGGNYELRYKDKKTNPNVSIRGGDENFLQVNGFTLLAGRNINALDVVSGRNVCILGSEAGEKLFGPNYERGVDKVIKVNDVPYRVVGVLKKKGSSALMRADNVLITTYNTIRRLGGDNVSRSFTIGIAANDVQALDAAVAEANATFRAIRKLHPIEDDNFVLEKSDKIAETFIGLLSSIQIAAAVIGFITLVGAAIGLMNIMLVAVNERTKEVGLIKALGGKRSDISRQFLFESIIISLMGAVCGIILGILLGNSVSMLVGTGFVVPWNWVVGGVFICSIVGLLAGLWPARRASKLDPIVALRFE
ncbi:MAG: ABC transporter permease [Chitinophagaceae bacterium]